MVGRYRQVKFETERVKGMPYSPLKPRHYSDWEQINIADARTEKEKQAIYRFRYHGQIEEMKRSIPYADHRRRRIVDMLDAWSYLAYAELEGSIIGTIRITIGKIGDFPSELIKVLQMDRFRGFDSSCENVGLVTKLFVESRYRKTPISYRLMARGYEILRTHNVQFVFSGCNAYLIPMYEQLGFRQIGPGFQDPGYGFVVPILFLSEDIDHLSAVHSPFLRIVRKMGNSAKAREWLLVNFSEAASFPVGLLINEQERWEYVTTHIGDPVLALPILQKLNHNEARKFLHTGTTFQCGMGQDFIRRGDVCNELNFLIAGEMKVTGARSRSWRAVSGDIVGSVGLLGQTHHKIDATAVADCHILAISRFSFEKLLRAQPDLAEKLNFRNR